MYSNLEKVVEHYISYEVVYEEQNVLLLLASSFLRLIFGLYDQFAY